MGRVYILGGSQTDFERNWSKEGKNLNAMLREVFFESLNNTALSLSHISDLNKIGKVEVFVGNFIAERYLHQGHLGAFVSQIDPVLYGVPCARYEAACASSSVAIEAAYSKIKSGDCDLAIVLGFEIMKSVDSKTCGEILGCAANYEEESKNVEFPFPKLFGKLASETIDKYGLDRENYLSALAKIVDINYSNAKRNPLSQTRKWFMNYELANSRGSDSNPYIGDVLASSDCSQITDGAVAIILASEKFVSENNYIGKPFIKGYGHRNAPFLFKDKIFESANDEYILPWTRQAVLDAYKISNLSVEDIDVFETHDCFSSSEFVAISSFGLTRPGYEIEAINNGLIDFNGDKPINPSGGLIGCGHPVGASGARMMLDIYKQVCNEAGDYQIPNSNNAMMLNIGGTATTNYVYIVGS